MTREMAEAWEREAAQYEAAMNMHTARALMERRRRGWPTLCDRLFAGADNAWGRVAWRKAEILAGLGHGDYLSALSAGARARGDIGGCAWGEDCALDGTEHITAECFRWQVGEIIPPEEDYADE